MTVEYNLNVICETQDVGVGTKIGAFTHVYSEVTLGNDCEIGERVCIESNVKIGNSVKIKSGSHISQGAILEDGVFIGPNVVFSSEHYLQTKSRNIYTPLTRVNKGASIGANSTILPGVTVGAGAMVGSGSVVTRDVPELAIVVGNPAKISAYFETVEASDPIVPEVGQGVVVGKTKLSSGFFKNLSTASDDRGSLVAAESLSQIPFDVKRIFLVHSVPSIESRGAHAHKECHQFLICVSGSVHVIVDDGVEKFEFTLDSPSQAVYMPPMTWGTQYRYSTDAVLLVLASHAYDPNDYIRSYSEFKAAVEKHS